MTTAYTSLLGLALPVQGELSGTWGDVVNNSITSLVDTSVAGTTNISTDANVTLTTTTGASNQARQAILLFSGARTAIRTVTAPAQSKIYTVINATTGGFAVTLVGAGPTTGVTIANGARTVVAWNGSDFVEVSRFNDLTVYGNLGVGTASPVSIFNASFSGGAVSGTHSMAFGIPYAANLQLKSTNSGTSVSVASVGLYSNPERTKEFAFYNQATDARVGYLGYQYVSGSAVTDLTLYNALSGALIFGTNNAEGMRLTSTGLGIGTTSPAYKLDVNTTGGSIATARLIGNDQANVRLRFENGGSGGRTWELVGGLPGANNSNFSIRDVTGGTTPLTIDSSGNLGLGVTPSASTSNYRTLQIGASGNSYSIFGQRVAGASETFVGWNAYGGSNTTSAASGFYYRNTGDASSLYTLDAQHRWWVAPSGTAGNAITFTQAMTLTSIGDFLLGTTTNTGAITGTNFIMGGAGGLNQITFQVSGSRSGYIYNSAVETAIGAPSGGVLKFQIEGSGTKATIDSSGNLLLGTTSGSGNNERLNITSSTNQTARFINTNATSGNISIVSTLGANTDNTSSYHILTATNGATRFYVYGNGTSGNASDQNLKKNIETTRDGYAEDLCKLRVVKYNWNDQADGSPKELGWIAQEVEQVFPNLVQDGIPNENGETFKEVKTSVLPFMLLKALQEQQAIIESLKARLDAANL